MAAAVKSDGRLIFRGHSRMRVLIGLKKVGSGLLYLPRHHFLEHGMKIEVFLIKDMAIEMMNIRSRVVIIFINIFQLKRTICYAVIYIAGVTGHI
jgi:hypothetical protein